MNIINKYSGVTLTYVENVLRLFYGIAILFVARHFLDSDAFANFAFYLALAILCYGLCKFSFDAYAIREFVLHPSDSLAVLQKIVAIRALGSTVIVLLVILGLQLFDKYEIVYVMLIVSQLVRAMDSVEWLLRAEGNLVLQALVRIASMLFVILALTLLTIYKPIISGWDIVVVQMSEWGVIFIFYTIIYLHKKNKYSLRRKIDRSVVSASIKRIICGSMYVYIGFVLFLLYSKIDQFLLKWLVEPDLYGVYMIAARLTESAVVIIMSLNMYFYPKLVSAHRDSLEAFSTMIMRVSRFFLLIAVLVVLFVWVGFGTYNFLPQIVRSVIPVELLEILSWMIISIVPVFFFGLRSSYFTITDNPKEILVGAFFGALFALVFGVPLMWLWGVYGGGASLVLAAAGSLMLSNFFSAHGRRYLRVVFRGDD